MPTRLLALCAFLASTSPLAIDLYLASFPAMQRSLDTSPGGVQLTLTAYLVGISIGQPLWGPISDRFGRRPSLLVSTSLTLASSVAVALAPTIGLLVAARLVQALSAAAGMVVARAMISDLVEGYAGVRALATMMTIQGLVPVVAPVLGGVLAGFLPWRGVLGVVAVVVLLQLAVTLRLVRETLPPARRTPRVDFRDLARVVSRPAYLTYAVTIGLMVGSVMAYVSSASFVYQEVLGLPPYVFGALFTLNALGMVAAGLLSSRLAARQRHPAHTVAAALPGTVVSSLLVVVLAASPWPLLIVLPIMTNTFFANLVMGNCMGLAMQQARGLSGAGSAMLGLFMFGLSAAVTPAVAALGGVRSAVPMGVVMAGTSLLAAIAFTGGRRWLARHPASEVAFV